MSLFKRGETWWVRFTTPNGQQVRRSAQTANKQHAQEFHDKLKSEYWRVAKLGEKPRIKWQQAVERWLLEKQGEKVTLQVDKGHLRWVHPYLYDVYLEDIDRDRIDRLTTAKLAEGVSRATVNRMLEVIRAILRRAERDWGWLDKSPHIRMLKEPKRRVRWLTPNEADRLLKELPEHLAEMMRFTLATGLRAANVCRLEWSQVDEARQCAWIHPDQAKARKAIPVPLNEDALAVLGRQKGINPVYVFTYRDKPVIQPNNHAWRKALKRAGIGDFRWHDLRHTWASWHIQQGTPLHVLQELGGWSSTEMVRRYAHLSADHLKSYADKLARPAELSTNSAQC
jgi:integrase